MTIKDKLKIYLTLVVKVIIDGLFLSFWALMVFVIHKILLPALGFGGLIWLIVYIVALIFDLATVALCLIVTYRDLTDEYHEIIKKKKKQENDNER